MSRKNRKEKLMIDIILSKIISWNHDMTKTHGNQRLRFEVRDICTGEE